MARRRKDAEIRESAEWRYDDERAARWLDGIDGIDYRPLVWTPEYVGERLVEAAGIMIRLPDAVGPAEPRTAWRRDVVLTHEEIKERDRFNADEKLRPKPAAPSMAEIGRASECLAWPGAYLSNDADVAGCVTSWAHWRAQALPWRAADDYVDQLAAEFYVEGVLTFHQRRKAGLARIAAGLNRDGVPVR